MTSARRRVAVVAASLDILGGQGVQARSLVDALRRDGHPVAFVPINPRFPRGLRWLRRLPYLRTMLNQALYVPSLFQLLARRRRARVLGVLLVVPAGSGPGDGGRTGVWQARRPALSQRGSGRPPRRSGVCSCTRGFAWPTSSSFRPTTWRRVFARHGYPTQVIRNVVDLTRFGYRERTPLQPRLLSTRNLEPLLPGRHHARGVRSRARRQYPDATLDRGGLGQRGTASAGSWRAEGVRFVGAVDPRFMPQLLADADIFVNASVVDNQPVSILEAFAAGLPVVSTPTGDIAAMVRHEETGLIVAPLQPGALAAAVLRLLRDPGLGAGLTARARQECERYTWSAVRGDWASAYATSGRRRPPGAWNPIMDVRTNPLTTTTLRRLRSMSLAEIAYRGRQEASKALERIAPAGRAVNADGWARAHAPALAAPGAALRLVREVAPRRFYAGVAEPSVADVLRTRFPEERDRIVAAAADALAGRFDLLGYRELAFGTPIDWHRDPVWSRSAPRAHWSRIDALDSATVGDSKVVWELNRHQWLVRLAQAWAVTRDTRYASACRDADRRVARGQPTGRGRELDEQPRGLLPPDVLVLDVTAHPGLAGSLGSVCPRRAGGDLAARGVCSPVSLVLLLAEHPSDR